ncbi:DUF2628 domain-containing protein [Microvirga arsenatis]|uniref:DUF2628 domain-containing protein n=1 Tax=Microvirga arsenatis TaxID=2692265 RepID=A0ABW9Z2X9_9HYPH|nr:DUF2628 domain-containing protein [Microvirga arsenatis]NBJ11365.1 DUF2628 domain-containing protein [Microvirga arsenatis]NBJ25638.1 DUF2628 domain-containing protein [Microvirga arsenatis]
MGIPNTGRLEAPGHLCQRHWVTRGRTMTAAQEITATQPSEADSASGSDRLLAAFVGPNHEVYRRALEKMRAKDPALRKLPLTWCWPAFLITLPWLLYRKLYGWAAGLIGAVLALSIIFPSLSSTGTLGAYAGLAMMAKPLYVQYALKRIGKLRSRAASEEELEALVQKAGGVSVPGAVIGTLLFIGFNVLAFLGSLAERG